MRKLCIGLIALALLLPSGLLIAQKRGSSNTSSEKGPSLDAFKFRNVGPAFLSGRIADIAIHPDDESVWYVAVGSGGVWKTENAGTTWKPLFDGQASYSIGCITIDSRNPSTIWVGSGENVGGRHVGFGDGVYRSLDGGASWKNMGLKNSEHISKIIVHPDNSDVVWVAVQGPLWSSGGERGLYKTTDGGESWNKVLGDDTWTGVTDLMIDPRDPQLLYAATWDRHRTVAAYMGGGPGTGIHRSYDGGDTWEELSTGLPKSNMGKIGLAISPQQPDVIYAAIELDRTKGGVYRSADRGSSWKKMSDAVSGGTGPHYYQELYASPHKFDRLYLMNVRVLTSEDGGKTFNQLKEQNKHSDNHVIAFKKDDPDYLMIGTDAGIYESFDLAENWRYIKNLPLTQFYKVAVNNAEPFYHIFGGTQDNGSVGGPSQTDEREGIANKHWYKTLFADGHQSATDPQYNDIIYAETQQGGLHRIDLTTGEQVMVQPQAQAGDPHERFNWDAPILVSPHDPSRLYFASYRVWKSDSRGDDWTPISGDLTRNEERITLPIMGRQQSWDNPWDVNAMSNYNTITSLSESPVKEGLLYAGTDDGYIAVSENDGGSWNRIPVTRFGLPGRSFVNDIKADLFDENTVYVVLDNHKEGDFKPYVFKSTDKGASWTSISSNIPERTLTWRIVQDYQSPGLMFLATEFGIYTTLDGGSKWHKLPGTPNMAFRDLVIQKREDDLVAASFGRGFYVLDDYSALRQMGAEKLAQPGALFAPRAAKHYVPRSNVGNTGADYYFAKNPAFGATFTYHLSDLEKSLKAQRKESEKALNKDTKNVPFPGWEALDEEANEGKAMLWLSIQDAQGNVIRNVSKGASKGSGRITWDLRHESRRSIRGNASDNRGGGWWNAGPMVTPGNYQATLYLEKEGAVTKLDGPVSFEVRSIREGVLKGVDYQTFDAYRQEIEQFQDDLNALRDIMDENNRMLKALTTAASRTPLIPGNVNQRLADARSAMITLEQDMFGNKSKNEIGERNPPSVQSHFGTASRGLNTTYGPTPLHRKSLGIAKSMMNAVRPRIVSMNQQTLPAIEQVLKDAGAPYIIGQGID
ncbi:WD40/YVTN/BNR-like repeat-containing protein [Aureitalea marina]|uniref:Glycosyl hydrolase n=1 Tax=Aureitalea marina TaxID=930804 RepID=A0A2S7KSH0_9FLAO|nr:glycosyl hydrolase [Aureitalea marina]PQB05574.1 glycosyl hydrolase [Aureitalea marina]